MTKNLIIQIVLSIFFIIAKLQILYLRKKSILITHGKSMGFGDSLTYMFFNYLRIKRDKICVFNYIGFTKNISDLLFGLEKSLILYPSLPLKFYYYYMDKYEDHFSKYSNFIKYKYDFEEWEKNKNLKYSFNRLIKVKLKKYCFKNIILPKKYFSMNIKYFNDLKNDLSNSHYRQVINLPKLVKVFKYLDEKKIFIIITNDYKELAFKKIKELKEVNNLKNIIFFNDLIKKPNFFEQCFLADNSIGYIGSDSGPQVLYAFLHKKVICIDACLDRPNYSRLYDFYSKKFSNYKFVTNKICIKNKIYELNLETIKKIRKSDKSFFLTGCTSSEIIKEINFS